MDNNIKRNSEIAGYLTKLANKLNDEARETDNSDLGHIVGVLFVACGSLLKEGCSEELNNYLKYFSAQQILDEGIQNGDYGGLKRLIDDINNPKEGEGDGEK